MLKKFILSVFITLLFVNSCYCQEAEAAVTASSSVTAALPAAPILVVTPAPPIQQQVTEKEEKTSRKPFNLRKFLIKAAIKIKEDKIERLRRYL